MSQLPDFVANAVQKPRKTKPEPLYSAADVATIFGYETVSGFWTSVSTDNFPRPTTRTNSISNKNKTKAFWARSIVLKEMRARNILGNIEDILAVAKPVKIVHKTAKPK